ncbi:MAG: acetate/propionate family kinase [Deinococcales bacterium]|nr:acetate/propionate family kinase [Chitinophagaceae bacterium]
MIVNAIKKTLLTVNSGSSNTKFTLYELTDNLTPLLQGQLDFLDDNTASLTYKNAVTGEANTNNFPINAISNANEVFISWLKSHFDSLTLQVIGHRIVFGMKHTEAQVITPTLLSDLKAIIAYDPEHLPKSISLIEAFTQHFPSIAQIACFDTSFHTTMPTIAKLLPIPRRYFNLGLQRYGFHGLSYAYLTKALQTILGVQKVATSNIIMAHLGNGASITALKNGISVDTSMGFTPASGIPMSTRSGNIDPGIAWYLMQVEKLNADQFNQLINHHSGLFGISETTGNMRELLQLQHTDTRAAEAIELFCYETKKYIGSYAAALGGLEIVVFSGGIGEHVPEVRSQICDGLEFLGIELCEIKNMNNAPIISTEKSKVTVYVIPTNEQLMMAKLVCGYLNWDVID